MESKSHFSNEERKQIVAETIKEIRVQSGYSQKQIAELLDVSPAMYSNYENAKYEPSIESLVRLSLFYNISMDTITRRDTFYKTKEELFNQIEEYEKQIGILKEQLALSDDPNNQEVKKVIESLQNMATQLKSTKSERTD